MLSNVSLITVEELEESFDKVDWSLCFVCQENDKKDLQNAKAKPGRISCFILNARIFCLFFLSEAIRLILYYNGLFTKTIISLFWLV